LETGVADGKVESLDVVRRALFLRRETCDSRGICCGPAPPGPERVCVSTGAYRLSCREPDLSDGCLRGRISASAERTALGPRSAGRLVLLVSRDLWAGRSVGNWRVADEILARSARSGALAGCGAFSSMAFGTTELVRGKRGLDIVVSSLGLILSSPLMAGIAILIKTTSSGPVIYSQVRVGQSGRAFRIHKFRSIRQGPPHVGAAGAVHHQAPVTPGCRLFRENKTH